MCDGDDLWDRLRSGGLTPFRALGNSMRPLYPSGTTFLIAPLSGATPRPGDLVLGRRGDQAVLHRVVAVADSLVTTKGDWCSRTDPAWTPSHLVGRAVAVLTPRNADLERTSSQLLGRILARVSTPVGYLLGAKRSLQRYALRPADNP